MSYSAFSYLLKLPTSTNILLLNKRLGGEIRETGAAQAPFPFSVETEHQWFLQSCRDHYILKIVVQTTLTQIE